MNCKRLGLFFLCFLVIGLGGDESAAGASGDEPAGFGGFIRPPIAPLIEPISPTGASDSSEKQSGVNWHGLFQQSAVFVGIEHAFRYGTEYGTRNAKGPLMRGYLDSVRNLHGWSDGDPFYVNYVGHPMQGAVSGYIWVHNDRDYASASIGMNSRYWKSRLRAAGFAWAYSTQFEIGPFSEASVGFIQSRHPQQGLVDHVVTPTLGMAWMVAEDAVDRYLLTALERRISNHYIRVAARGFLNPTRSMANMVRGKVPYYREGRSISEDYRSGYTRAASHPSAEPILELPPDDGRAPFELTASSTRRTFIGSDAPGVCAGGGGEAAFRMSSDWQLIIDVNGCKLGGLPQNISGDTLSYLVGPRWTPSERRLRPYMQFLVGGTKLTKEIVSPETQKLLEAAAERNGTQVYRHEYATKEVTHSFAVAAGTGLDLKLSRAAALKLASLEYTRSWNKPLDGIDYSTGLQLKLGVTLRMGTW